MEGQLLVYPLYYKFSEGDIPENIRRCEEISRQCGAGCVFRIVEHTNYHLSSILTDNGYGLEKCGVVGEWNLTGDAGKLCMEGRENAGRAVPEKRERRDGVRRGGRDGCRDKAPGAFIPAGREPDGYRLGGHPAVCSGKWNRKDTGRYSGGGRTAGAVWAAGFLQGLSLPPLSEKSGGEILQKRGLKDGFTE